MATMSSHHKSGRGVTNSWLTPPEIINALGQFDLDPCCPPSMPWKTAANMLTERENGLACDWSGRVWLNPPYGPEAEEWLLRLADHGAGTALVFARTETRWFKNAIWDRADALLFIHGRIHFHLPNGTRALSNSGAPSVLVAYGDADKHALKSSGICGAFVEINRDMETRK